MKQKLLSLGLSLALVLGLAAGCAPKAGPGHAGMVYGAATPDKG